MTGASWTAHDWYKTSMFFGCVAVLLFFSALSGLFANIGLPASAETQATVGVGCILLLLLCVSKLCWNNSPISSVITGRPQRN